MLKHKKALGFLVFFGGTDTHRETGKGQAEDGQRTGKGQVFGRRGPWAALLSQDQYFRILQNRQKFKHHAI